MNNLKVAVVPVCGTQIDQNSPIEEVLACIETTVMSVEDYLQAQNDDSLPSHWSFPVYETGEHPTLQQVFDAMMEPRRAMLSEQKRAEFQADYSDVIEKELQIHSIDCDGCIALVSADVCDVFYDLGCDDISLCPSAYEQKVLTMNPIGAPREMGYVCQCNKCSALLIDENPQVDAERRILTGDELEMVQINGGTAYEPEWIWSCPNCLSDDFLSDTITV